jgi:AcrR family transcriptional regulator
LIPTNPGRPSLREAQKAFTHERLLEAAESEFAARGYAATTVDQIVARAGATRATFYLHFRSKADVVLELIEFEKAVFHPLWDLLKDFSKRPSRAVIRDWLVTAAHTWDVHGQRTRVIFQAVQSDPHLAATADDRADEELDWLVQAVRHLGWGDESRARLECMLWLAQLARAFTYWSFRDPDDRDERLLDILADNWWAVLNRAADLSDDLRPAGTPVASGRGRRRARVSQSAPGWT